MKVLLIRDSLLSSKQSSSLRKMDVDLQTIQVDDFMNFQNSSETFDFELIIGATELRDLEFAKYPQLKYLQIISAGYDYLKINKVFDRGVKLFNASGVYSIPIAEWVIGLILADYKKLEYFYNNHIANKWIPMYKLKELTGKKVLIFGTGSIGSEIAKRLNIFQCIIDGVNTNGRNVDFFNDCYKLENAITIINNYDVIVFALPSNKRTIKYVDKDFLKNLTSETIVINVGRGDLINEMDLINYSNQSKNNVRFYLDVVNDEPLDKEDKLWKCKNIFITPHNSFSSDLHRERLQSLIFENITSIINKSKLRNEVKGE